MNFDQGGDLFERTPPTSRIYGGECGFKCGIALELYTAFSKCCMDYFVVWAFTGWAGPDRAGQGIW